MRSDQGIIYKIGKKLGHGAYGNVFIITRVTDNVKFAYKNYISTTNDLDVGALREISILKMLKDSGYCDDYGIVSLQDIITTKYSVGIVLPLYKLSLDDAINKNLLSGKNKLIIYHKLLRSICFLHENNIIHRDIKPDNVMLDYEYNPILIDFTLSKMFYNNKFTQGETHTGGISTECYRAPEVESKKSYGFPSDAWSLGVVLKEMYNSILPIFSGFLDPNPNTRLSPHDALYYNFKQLGTVNIYDEPECSFVQETIGTICENLEIDKTITYSASQLYYDKTECDPYIAVLLACKFYETVPMDMGCLEIEDDFAEQELIILKKMGYNLNVIEMV